MPLSDCGAGGEPIKKHIAMVTVKSFEDNARLFEKEAPFLVKNGWRVTFVAPYEPDGKSGTDFVTVKVKKSRLGRILLSQSPILRAAERTDAPIIFLNDAELAPLIPILRNMGKKVIFDYDKDLSGLASLSFRTLPFIKQAENTASLMLLRRYLLAADAVIASAEGTAEALTDAGFSPCLVRNRPTEEDIELTERALLREKPLENSVCCLGTISERAGAESMIRACRKAGATLLLAGNFESDAFRIRLENTREYSCVRYEGKNDRTKRASLLARTSVGLLMPEGSLDVCGSEVQSLFEYLASGMPAVAPDRRELRDFSVGGRIKFAGDEDEAARLIRKTLDDTAMLGQLRFRRREMQRLFSFANEGERLIGLLDDLSDR